MKKMEKNMKILVALIAAVLLTAPLNAQSVPKDTADLFQKAGVRLRQPIPVKDFSLRLLDGSEITISAFKDKVVFLNFWATWCPPCRAEMPSMEILFRRFKDKNFVMIAVDLQETSNEVASYMRANGLTFPVGIDNGAIGRMYSIAAVPTTFIIWQNAIIGSVVGSRDWNTPALFDAFAALLN